MDVADFEFPTDPMTGRVQLALRERNGRIVSSYAASDGTLRLLAMLAALLGPNPAGLYVFEEIDNGIHPARQRLLLDLIEGQTAEGRIQVVTTTHSPDLLELVGDRTFEHTSVVCRLPDTDDAVVRPLADLPKAGTLRKSQGLGRLHRSNWMEDAILFTSSDTASPTAWGRRRSRSGAHAIGRRGRAPHCGDSSEVPGGLRPACSTNRGPRPFTAHFTGAR